MYVTTRSRIEYGIRWTRHRTTKGRTAWKSPKAIGIVIVQEPVRYGRSRHTFNRWFARQGRRYFFSTTQLRRAFRVSANHAHYSKAFKGLNRV
jgi:hypothetical protein